MRGLDVELTPLDVAIVALVDEGLGNSAYVVDLGDGGALVVDPECDPRPVPRGARTPRATPRFVAATHLHADLVSGGRELAARGASLLAPADEELSFHHRGLADGIDTWNAAGREVATTALVDGSGGVEGSGVVDGVVGGRRVVDVRQSSEWESGHVPGATRVELGSLVDGVEGVPDQPVLVHCGHGERAMSGASLLERAGRRDLAVLLGPPRSLGELEGGAEA